jgi:competence protein ComEC
METKIIAAAGGRPVFLRPLVPVGLALMAGIFIGALVPGWFAVAAALAGVMAIVLVHDVQCGRSALGVPLMFCAVAGYLAIQPWLGREWPSDHVSRLIDQGKWQISGTVAEASTGHDFRRQFVLRAEQMRQADKRLTVRGSIRISVRGRISNLERGDRVTVSGHLRAIRGFRNPDGFDYERFMALQGVHARLYAQAESVRVEKVPDTLWTMRLDRVRCHLSAKMDSVLQNEPPAVVYVLKALTLGERDGLPDALREAFSRAGVSHVLAISGLHIGMVAAAAFAFFSRVLVWVPQLVTRAWVRRSAAGLSLLPVVGYGLLAGLSPSTQRAMIMVAAFLATYWIGRGHDLLNALAVAALAILIMTPPALLGVSFQLSFAAVLAIVLGLKALPRPKSRVSDPLWRRWSWKIAVFMGVSVFATLGTAPLVMRYFNQISWLGVVSNLLVVPLAGMVIVPAGLLGVAVAPLSDPLCILCWKIAAFGLQAMLMWVEWIAHCGFAASTTVTPSILEIGLFYLLLATLLLWKTRLVRMIGLTLVVGAGIIDATYWMHRRFGQHQMTVTAVDIGQGSANVIQMPGGFTMLVDGGGFSDGTLFDVGRSVVAPYLWANKIKTIDLVVLTHADSDHLNGLLFILNHFNVGQVWSNGETVNTKGYLKWQAAIVEKRIDQPLFEQLPRHTVIDPGVHLTLLGPREDFMKQTKVDTWRDRNSNSLVLRLCWEQISFLFTGDITAPVENDLITRHGSDALRSTILLVPHHGSRSSSSAAFIDAVHPSESIIPVGWRNRFRFPHPTILERLEISGSRIWRTDLCGAVQVVTDGHDYQVQPCRKRCR